MKKLISIFTFVVTLNIVFAIFPGQTSAQQNDVNFQEFYDQLSPYGQWVEDSNYGYVWIPNTGPDFAPYLTNGYWVLTDYGWMWESEYNWGWAPFHYGRWDYNDSYGWFWVPDNQWGPSWVIWRRSGGYYGWAPMRPGISITISFGSYYNIPYDHWVFVRDRDFERHDIGKYYIDRRNNINIIKNSTVINKTYYDGKRRSTYVAGPSREDVQKYTGRTINPVAVHDRNSPGQNLTNGQVQIYRPQIQKNNSGRKPAPPKLTNLKDVKRIQVRNAEKQPQNLQMQDSKTGKGQQQPGANLPKKTSSNVNPPQQRSNNSLNDSKTKGRQPAVKPGNKIDNKINTYQPQRLDPPQNNQKDQPAKLRNTNPPINNNRKIPPYQKPNLTPPTKENRKVQPKQPQKISVQKNNNGTNKSSKVRVVKPPKKNSADQPSKSNSNNDKNENRNQK